jgi:hypothetical protein
LRVAPGVRDGVGRADAPAPGLADGEPLGAAVIGWRIAVPSVVPSIQ